MPVATVEFFFDFISPYSYLASTRIEAVAKRASGEVRFRPFLLGGVFKATGNRPPAEVPAKLAYILRDLDRWTRRYGVPLNYPSAFPFSTLLALRSALVAEKSARLVPFTHAVYRAVWVEDQDIASEEVVARIASSVGLDGPAVVAAAPAEKEPLMRQTQEAVDRGSFGAPTFFVGDELFVGNDRLDFVEAALRAAGEAPGAAAPPV